MSKVGGSRRNGSAPHARNNWRSETVQEDATRQTADTRRRQSANKRPTPHPRRPPTNPRCDARIEIKRLEIANAQYPGARKRPATEPPSLKSERAPPAQGRCQNCFSPRRPEKVVVSANAFVALVEHTCDFIIHEHTASTVRLVCLSRLTNARRPCGMTRPRQCVFHYSATYGIIHPLKRRGRAHRSKRLESGVTLQPVAMRLVAARKGSSILGTGG